MVWIKNIAVIVFCLSISLAGVPSYAHEQCPLEAHESTAMHHQHGHMVENDAAHHKHCDGHDHCCLNCSVNLALLNQPFSAAPVMIRSARLPQYRQALPVSTLLQTQDRHPKRFS